MKTNPSILVVDDSPVLVQSISSVLEHNEYQVDAAFNGYEAMNKLKAQNYEILICDIDMPGISGLDLLEHVRQDQDRNLDVILMTGFLEPQYFIRAIQLGAADFISKPIESQHLVSTLRNVLERRSSRDDMANFMMDLETAHVSLVIDPAKLSLSGISGIFKLFFKQNLNLDTKLYNELLVCLDEMIYNAFIHGTLSLDPEQRGLENQLLQQIIAQKLSHPDNIAKRIHFSLSVDHAQDQICIEVVDDGVGFDYQSWLDKVAMEPKLNLDEHGRGIAMLYHIADILEYTEGGRKVRITRKLHPELSPGA